MRFDLWRSINEIRYLGGKKGKKTTPRSCAKFSKTFLGLISWFIRSYCSRFTASGERKKQYQLFAESNPWFIVFFNHRGCLSGSKGVEGTSEGVKGHKGRLARLRSDPRSLTKATLTEKERGLRGNEDYQRRAERFGRPSERVHSEGVEGLQGWGQGGMPQCDIYI